MTHNISRLKHLAGLYESDDVDDGYEKFSENLKVERLVSNIILQVFKKANLAVVQDYDSTGMKDSSGVSYDIAYDLDSNDATVIIEDCTLDQLISLKSSGLSSSYNISGTVDGTLRVNFSVNPAVVKGTARFVK